MGAKGAQLYTRRELQRGGHAQGNFFDPCPNNDLLGGALSAVQLFGRRAVLETHTL